jgi:hypothetical protein
VYLIFLRGSVLASVRHLRQSEHQTTLPIPPSFLQPHRPTIRVFFCYRSSLIAVQDARTTGLRGGGSGGVLNDDAADRCAGRDHHRKS